MRHMNRVLVGTMLEVAGGRRDARRLRARCWTAGPAREAGPTAPPHGLALRRASRVREAPVRLDYS